MALINTTMIHRKSGLQIAPSTALLLGEFEFSSFHQRQVLDSALITFWRFGSSSRYIGSRSNQRSTSQPLSCRQSSPSSAASALAVIRLLGLVFCS
jgi:hypothetical protein